MGVFMTVVLTVLLGGILLPETVTNFHLDSLPVTPLAEVHAGGSFKVFAAVAPGQSNVVVGGRSGPSGSQSWGWTAHNFWLVENGTRLFVNASGIVDVRPPGSPWGSDSGTVVFTAGTLMAAYGPTRSTPNGTTLFVQYVAQYPNAMGHVGGDLWPLYVGFIGGSAAVASVSAVIFSAQVRQHRKVEASQPPRLDPPVVPPNEPGGTYRQYSVPKVEKLARQSKWWMALGSIPLAFGALVLPVVPPLAIFILPFGLMMFLISASNGVAYGNRIVEIGTDHSGLFLRSLRASNEALDPYIPWSNIRDYYIYYNRLLAVRTNRGEYLLTGLEPDLLRTVKADLEAHGIAAGTSTVTPPLGTVSPSMTPSPRDRLAVQRKVNAFSIGMIVAMTTAIFAGPVGFIELALAPLLGDTLLLLAVASALLAVILSSRIALLNWKVAERMRTTGL